MLILNIIGWTLAVMFFFFWAKTRKDRIVEREYLYQWISHYQKQLIDPSSASEDFSLVE